MKSSILAVAAAMALPASAANYQNRHAHERAHEDIKFRAIMASGTGAALVPTGVPSPSNGTNGTCGCKTVTVTETGAWTWIPNPPEATSTSAAPLVAIETSASVVNSTSSAVVVAPSTSSVYVAPTTSSVYVAPTTSSVYVAPTTSSVYVAPTTSSVYIAPTTSSVYVAPTTSSVYIAPSSTLVTSTSAAASASPSASSSSSASHSSSGGIGASGARGITYTPYSSTGECLSYAQVLIDLTLIKAKGFNAIRTYSTDCSTLENVGGVAEIVGLKLIMGIYIDNTGVTGTAATQVTAIASWGKWDLVEMFVIGNEAVFNQYTSVTELVSFIQSTKATFDAAGYSGTYTTAEPLNIVYELVATAGFCDTIDYVGGNYHPFFNAQVTAEEAGTFVAAQLTIADGLCSGKTGINLETGWPTAGSCNGAACPSQENQKTAVASIVQHAGANSVVFSFQNDLWKSAGEYGCEQSWGLIDLFSTIETIASGLGISVSASVSL